MPLNKNKWNISLTQSLLNKRSDFIYEALMEELQLSQAERYTSLERSLQTMPSQSRRWAGEMEEIAKTFEELGLTPRIYQGAADIYRFVGKTSLAAETPETLDKNRTLVQLVEVLAKT